MRRALFWIGWGLVVAGYLAIIGDLFIMYLTDWPSTLEAVFSGRQPHMTIAVAWGVLAVLLIHLED